MATKLVIAGQTENAQFDLLCDEFDIWAENRAKQINEQFHIGTGTSLVAAALARVAGRLVQHVSVDQRFQALKDLTDHMVEGCTDDDPDAIARKVN